MQYSRRCLLFVLVTLWPLWLAAQPTPAPQKAGVQLRIDGPIGPATSDYFHRGLREAVDQGAPLVVLQMDTPGGLSSSMRDIIRDILASPIPIITYVAPSGARAASAGTYILYASHIAAMAPATNVGAATPVQIGPGGRSPLPSGGKDEKGTPGSGDAMTHKIVNDAVAYIRGLATLRGRNADWAEKAVREAASLNAKQALSLGVIDLIAKNTPELLKMADGRTVQVKGKSVTLRTAGVPLREVDPDWRSRLLAIITNPNVAYILMLIGIYGLIFEFSNPGTFLPGIMGAICLMLALFAFQVLPINYAGVGLILLGVALMVAEAFAPSFGALGIGGVIAFVIGSVILIDTRAPGFGISVALIGAVALFSATLLALMLGMIVRARRRPIVSGAEEMIGANAEALEDFSGEGMVRAHGERWRARTATPLHKGQRVRVIKREGLTLEVVPEQKAERKGD